jgi:trehalose 6-phosphate synthase
MSRLTVVANRLPVRIENDSFVPSPGGLVSALAPVLTEQSGRWVGWVGAPDREDDPFVINDILHVPVSLSSQEVEDYYEGFCNGTVWPLYHDAIRSVAMHRHWWRPYEDVNERFAEAAVSVLDEGDTVWVQDYQLQLVPQLIRHHRPDARIGFFLHIPFPPPEIFGRLPWRRQVLEGLLGADVVQLHTRRDQRNFARAARLYTSATGPLEELTFQGRQVRTEAQPISIDYQEFRDAASSEAVNDLARQLRYDIGDPDYVVLGVDRLDYTKGIDIRLRAFETLLHDRPDLHGRVVMVQIAVPSREAVGEYQVIREDVERLVGRINGTFGKPGWVPVQYRYSTVPREELIAHYLAADVLLVTPLRDGMNLVAMEYVACRRDEVGAMILSEFAGAAEQLDGALVVNPYDADQMATTLGDAIDMPAVEQRSRMKRLRRRVRRWNVHTWAAHCLESIGR